MRLNDHLPAPITSNDVLSLFLSSLDVAELRRLQGPDRDERKFRFRGILKIANPDWLSEFGRKTIETALNLRAKERAMGLGEGSRRAPPELTLDYLFERHLKKARDSTRQEDETCLTVLIQGEKNMSAVYMVCACRRWLLSGGVTHVLIAGRS